MAARPMPLRCEALFSLFPLSPVAFLSDSLLPVNFPPETLNPQPRMQPVLGPRQPGQRRASLFSLSHEALFSLSYEPVFSLSVVRRSCLPCRSPFGLRL